MELKNILFGRFLIRWCILHCALRKSGIVEILLKQDFQWGHITVAPRFTIIDIKLFLMVLTEMLSFDLLII